MADRPPCPADEPWDGEVWCERCCQWHEPGPCEHDGPWWEWPDETITLGPTPPPASWLHDTQEDRPTDDDEPTEAELARWEEQQEAAHYWDRVCEERATTWPMAWLNNPGVN